MTTFATKPSLNFTDRLTASVRGGIETELIVDNFAGAGGASLGIEAALGRCVDIAINHSKRAVEIHSINHPNTRHLCEDVWDVDPLEATGGRPVGLAWFSPDCKHFSKAKGGKPLSKRIRGLAWIVIRWAKAVKPRVIILENVEEFVTWGPLDKNGAIVKEKKGQTFLRWKATLRNLGYEVEHRELVAADYGVPTTRKRFFLVARCDGLPIAWPQRTHAPRKKARELHLKPWRSAAECIDWTLPCPSIFERKRPLAEMTMRRIARGIMRYVINAAEPFIVTCNHAGATGGLRSADEPMRTVTGSRDANGVVIPHVTKFRSGATGSEVGDPMPTITAGGGNPERPAGAAHALGLVPAYMVRCAHGEESASGKRWGEGTEPMEAPLPTVTASKDFALISPSLVSIANYGGERTPANDAGEPLTTITAHPDGGHHAAVEAFLSKYHGENGDVNGRASDPAVPISTLDTQNRFGLVSATLMTNTSGHACTDAQKPSPTLTSGQQQAVAAATLQRFNYGEAEHVDPRNPMQTVTAGGNHHGVVSASLVGVGGRAGQSPERSVEQPAATITAKGDAALAAAHLTKLYGTNRSGADVAAPVPTITGSSNHVGEVRAFLVKYYSHGGQDQDARNPMHTITDRARMGLVNVRGVDYQITDIGLRMLQPAELLRAQFGRFAKEYILHGTKADQVAAIGNSVCPELAEAIVRSNFGGGV